jgi:ABC-2 type transport system ATP-binding protein
MDILKVVDLEKSYIDPDTKDHFKAVDGISFEIKANQIYGILGPNGAGKTTTLEMIEGLTDIDGGFAYVKGINVAEKPFKVKEIIGVQLQSNEYFDSLSLKELLILFGKLYKNDVDVAELLNSVNLIDKINAKPEELSGGQRQRFSIACALVNKPDVLFLDEPTTGLDPQAKHNLWKLIRDLNQLGMSIVLTTHNMEEAENLCHKVAIMDKGKIITEGSPNDLIAKFDSDNTEKGNLENVFLHLTGRDLRD